MKNEHLIPANVLDLAEKISSQTAHENERLNYLIRLEAIRDYCDIVLKKSKPLFDVTDTFSVKPRSNKRKR